LTFNKELHDIEVKQEKVDKKIRKLLTSAAVGPDRIDPV
jgi:hypothetical protein